MSIITSHWENTDQIKSLESVEDELKHGPCIYYYSNGKIKEKTSYLRGDPHGLHVRYDKDGNKEVEVQYKKGYLHGRLKQYKNGTLVYEAEFKNGELISNDTSF